MYHFLDDEELLEINKTHLAHDYYTDIITFDYSKRNNLIGEIYISMDRVKDNARDGSFTEELCRVMSHGILHMIGYKDKDEKDRMIMRNMEDSWVSSLVSRES